ncbi:class I SAM-dependent methyltransferase [Spirillospora sp. CA-294931]|uniref:class I SAM-dependent methyltransferase n=1 Tax=Spirillospora sp. CA-294931 TaxID=3240042 RepID=UPI003D8DA466
MSNGPMYERFAEDYAAHAVDSAYNALYDRPAVLGLAGEVRGRTVLDAGCGPGLYAEELVRRGARVIGFDQSPTFVKLARDRAGDGADLRVHDLTEPLDWVDDRSVDVVVLALALHYVDDRVAVLRELHRVLAPGGALVLSTHHPMDDWKRLGGSYFAVEVLEESLSPDREWPVRVWRRPLTEICREFKEAGFVIEELLEPRPVEEMAVRYPEHYRGLLEFPAFIAFRLLPV